MKKLFFSIVLTILVMPQLFGQSAYTLGLKNSLVQKVYLEKTADGTTFVGIRNKREPHAEFRILDSAGAELHTVAVPAGDEIIDTYSHDGGITIYTISAKDSLLLSATTLSAEGKATSSTILKLSAKEDLVTIFDMHNAPALVTVNREDQLTVRPLAEGHLLNTHTFAVKDPLVAKRMRKGISLFSGDGLIPTYYLAKARAKAFYDKEQLIFVLDEPRSGSPVTLVNSYDLAGNTSTSNLYDMAMEGFYESNSYVHAGHLYRFFNKGRQIQINVHPLDSKELLGSYGLTNDSVFTATKPIFVHKQYSSRLLNITPLPDYKSRSRLITIGQETLFVLPLANGGIQLNVGSYYENNGGIAPGGMGAIGILLFVATTTAKSLHDSGKGIENGLSLNFENPKLNKLIDSQHKSSLNKLDEIYKHLIQVNRKLSFFDYCFVGGEYYVAYAASKEKEKLQLIPFSAFYNSDGLLNTPNP